MAVMIEETTNRFTKSAIATLAGLACGDALGATNEFVAKSTAQKNKLTEIVGGGWLHLNAGDITDDTEMAICLVDGVLSSINAGKMSEVVRAVVKNFIAWQNGGPKDIGSTISGHLNAIKQQHKILLEILQKPAISNGALMRTAPLSLLPLSRRDIAYLSQYITRTTHPGKLTELVSCAYNLLLHDLIHKGVTKQQFPTYVIKSILLAAGFCFDLTGLNYLDVANDLCKKISATHPSVGASKIENTGLVIDTFIAAIWAVDSADTAKKAIMKAAALGGDSDTIAAVSGALAGALHAEIVDSWVDVLEPKALRFIEKAKELISLEIHSFEDDIKNVSIKL